MPNEPSLKVDPSSAELTEPGTGNVSYAPEDHQRMVTDRAAKVAALADVIPEMEVFGDDGAELLLLSWGGTYGTMRQAQPFRVREVVDRIRAELGMRRVDNPQPLAIDRDAQLLQQRAHAQQSA